MMPRLIVVKDERGSNSPAVISYINYGTHFDKVDSVERFRVKVLFPAAMAVGPARLPTSSTVPAVFATDFFDLDTVL